MKKTMIVALLAAAGTATMATAVVRETVTIAGPATSLGLVGNPGNTVATAILTGTWDNAGTPTAYTVQQLVFDGTIAGGFLGEASILVTAPGGEQFVISPRRGGTSPATYTGLITIPVGAISNVAGTWTFQFFDLFDDGGSTGVDSTFTNVTIGFDDDTPVTGAQPDAQTNVNLTNVLADGIATVGFVTTGFTVSGSSNTAGRVRISGTATSLRGPAASTTASAVSNLRFAVVRPDGVVSAVLTPTFTGIGGVAGTSPSSSTFVGTLSLGAVVSENGNWTLRSFTAADIPGGPDVGMRDVTVSFLPPPPPPPSTPILLTANTTVTDTITVTAPQTVRWYSIFVPEVSAAVNRALRIDNEGSSTTPVNDTAMALYALDGTVRLSDALDGTDSLASMSFGIDNGAAPGNGVAYNGRDGTLTAGTYYLAVVAGTTPTWGTPFNPTAVSATATAATLRTNFLLRDPAVSAPASTTITLSEGAFASANGSIDVAGGVAWFTFTTPAGLDSTGALDIDVEGTALAPTNDSEIYLFGPGTGALIASNTDAGTDLLSQLSFGAAGVRRERTSNGLVFAGQNGTVGAGNTILPNTQYYLAVAGGNASIGAAGYGVSGGANTGPVTARVRSYTTNALNQPAQPPASAIDLGTFGAEGATETVVTNSWTMANAQEVKWFRFATPASVTGAGTAYLDIDTDLTNPGGALLTRNVNDTHLGLFSPTGAFLISDDDSGIDQRSALSFGNTAFIRPANVPTAPNAAGVARNGRNSTGATATLDAGTYYVSVATFLPTYAIGWDVTPDATSTGLGDRVIAVRTNFAAPVTCVCCNLSNVAGPNQSTTPDNELTADDIIVFLGWYFANDNRANVAGPNQSTTPDNELTADDIIVFLGRYFTGC
jgi:hypothetical protein